MVARALDFAPDRVVAEKCLCGEEARYVMRVTDYCPNHVENATSMLGIIVSAMECHRVIA